MEKSIEDLIKSDVENGFIDENGKPLKCHKCGCTKTEMGKHWIEDGYLVEYEELCQSCKTKLGHWVYGYWQL